MQSNFISFTVLLILMTPGRSPASGRKPCPKSRVANLGPKQTQTKPIVFGCLDSNKCFGM